MKRLVFILVMASLGLGVSAQTDSVRMTVQTLNELENMEHSNVIPIFQYWKEHDIFQHLDVSVTAGTTGV